MLQRATFLGAAFLLFAQAAWSQSDAEKDFQRAMQAYVTQQYEQARDLLIRASQTDGNNPDVFLWLGRAQHALGAIDDALDAWRRTLTLAPDQAYARRMIETLTDWRASAEGRLDLVRSLLEEELEERAADELAEARRAGVPEALRGRALALEAEIDWRQGDAESARVALQRLAGLDAATSESARVRYVTARVWLEASETAARGRALLAELVRDVPDGVEGRSAQWDLIAIDLDEALTLDAARTWLQENRDHARWAAAAETFVARALRRSAASGPRRPDEALADLDRQAIEVAGRFALAPVAAARKATLLGSMIKSWKTTYAACPRAIADGAAALLQASWSRPLRIVLAEEEASRRAAHAIETLEGRVVAGEFEAERTPEVNAALEAFARLDALAEPGAHDASRLGFARTLAALGDRLEVAPGSARPPQDWAVEIALDVLRTTRDGTTFGEAREVVVTIARVCAAAEDREERARGLALEVRLVDAVQPTDPRFADILGAYMSALAHETERRFQENVAQRRDHENGRLDDLQEMLAKTCARLIRAWPARSDSAFQAFQESLAPWVNGGHHVVVEAAFTAFETALDGLVVDDLEIARLEVWVRQVRADHERLLTAGLALPDQLTELERRVLTEAYRAVGRFAFDEVRLQRVLHARSSLITFHRKRRAFALVEQALAVRAEPRIVEADALAALGLARVRTEEARIELLRLRQRRTDEGAAPELPAGARSALEAWQAFLSEHANTSHRATGLTEVWAFVQMPRRLGASTACVALLRAMETYFAGAEAYAAPSMTSSSLEAQCALAIGEVLTEIANADATRRLVEGPLPDELAPAFEEAWTAYRHVVVDHADRPEVARAVQGMEGLAAWHATQGSWNTAASLFGRMEAAELGLANRSRYGMRRASCELGKVLPDLARTSLAGVPGGPPAPQVEEQTEEVDVDPAATTESDDLALERHGLPSMGGARSSEAFAPSAGRAYRLKEMESGLAALHARNAQQATRIAALRDEALSLGAPMQQRQQGMEPARALSDAEIERHAAVFASVYDALLVIERGKDGETHRHEVRGLVDAMIGHWREVRQWRRAADLARRFLADHAGFLELPAWRLAIARDELAWAAISPTERLSRQERLEETTARFDAARTAFEMILSELPDEHAVQSEAQWGIATSWWTQARVIAAMSPTLARGQYVRAASELAAIVRRHPRHARLGEVPTLLAQIGNELTQRGFHAEAITVWSDLRTTFPASPIAGQVARQIAETYRAVLDQPLRAVDAYLELEFATGSDGQGMGNVIFQIAQGLQSQRRWIETLHVLETFVDSFPQHALAGQALTMIGQVHEANEAWVEALAAYRRVVTEYGEGDWLKEARWSIANGTINLSRWREAIDAYREFAEAWSDDARVPEAQRRIVVLKNLARYQDLVDEEGQRKAFDAQYQIGRIVHQELGNRPKAVLEYRKVAQRWPESHLADDALYQIGLLYLEMGETERSREALFAAAERYPGSPLADDAWFLIGASFEQQAEALANVTRDRSLFEANDLAQREAYKIARGNRAEQRRRGAELLAEAKKSGKDSDATIAYVAAQNLAFDNANVEMVSNWVGQQVEVLSAEQLADRQDKINAALRRAVMNFGRAAAIPTGDKNAEALLRMAKIYDERLDDREAAMKTWVEIATQYSGTAVAADASWKIAQVYERQGEYQKAIDAYTAYLRNYRRSERAGDAQFATAEAFEHLGKWVEAMDAYTKYVNNFPEGSLVERAKEQINWIKTYRL